MVNHSLRSRTNRAAAGNCNVYLIPHGDGPVTVRDLAKGLRFEEACKLAKTEAGRGSAYSKYGPTSGCYVGNGVTAVISW